VSAFQLPTADYGGTGFYSNGKGEKIGAKGISKFSPISSMPNSFCLLLPSCAGYFVHPPGIKR
jgi:hypothetical protein